VNAFFAAPIRLESAPHCIAHSFIADNVGDFTELATAHSIFAVAAQVFPTLHRACPALYPNGIPIALIPTSI